jgi:RHS repeat-associated protein
VHDSAGTLVAEYSNTPVPSGDVGTQYLTYDHLGSTRLITNATGVARCYDYLPFGEELVAGVDGRNASCYETGTETLGQDVESTKFTGKERDAETGLDYFGARYFSGAQGRWTSPDWSAVPQPIPYADLTNPQTLNLYSYVRNNPLSQSDQDGHCCWDYIVGFAKGTANRALDSVHDLAKNGAPEQRLINGAVDTKFRFTANGGDQQAAMQFGYKHGDTTIGLAVVVAGAKGGKGALPDDALVVRGGSGQPGGANSVEGIIKGTGTHPEGPTGFSVESAAGKTMEQLITQSP